MTCFLFVFHDILVSLYCYARILSRSVIPSFLSQLEAGGTLGRLEERNWCVKSDLLQRQTFCGGKWGSKEFVKSGSNVFFLLGDVNL